MTRPSHRPEAPTGPAPTVPAPTVPAPGRRHALVDSALGELTVVADDAGALAGLYLPDHRPPPPESARGARVRASDPLLVHLVAAVSAYLEGSARSVDVPLADVPGTDFQRAVWEQVLAIPRGSTRTYAQVAEAVGRPGARRAVGAALASDPRCLAVPCHRVVGERGAVTGYSGGVERKRWLLDLEATGAPPPRVTSADAPVTADAATGDAVAGAGRAVTDGG